MQEWAGRMTVLCFCKLLCTLENLCKKSSKVFSRTSLCPPLEPPFPGAHKGQVQVQQPSLPFLPLTQRQLPHLSRGRTLGESQQPEAAGAGQGPCRPIRKGRAHWPRQAWDKARVLGPEGDIPLTSQGCSPLTTASTEPWQGPLGAPGSWTGCDSKCPGPTEGAVCPTTCLGLYGVEAVPLPLPGLEGPPGLIKGPCFPPTRSLHFPRSHFLPIHRLALVWVLLPHRFGDNDMNDALTTHSEQRTS